MKRLSLLVLTAVLVLGGCHGKSGQNPGNQAAARRGDQPSRPQLGVTPMAERVAVLGFLNKRNGIERDITLKPGQSIQLKDAIVRLQACETTAPWEEEKLTGAFVQLDVQQTDKSWRRIFSGWLYKESPSLNVVEHPVYDVWPKSCAMTFPDAAGAPAAPDASSNRSSAEKSGAAAPSAPPSTATDSNAT